MNKKIVITTLSTLVIMISMTSTLFAYGSGCTDSFNYRFWNADPLLGTSYGVTYLDTIEGTNLTGRNCYVSVSILSKDKKSRLSDSDDCTNNVNKTPNIDVSKNTNTSDPRNSNHTASVTDDFGTFSKSYSALLNCWSSGTKTIPDFDPNR